MLYFIEVIKMQVGLNEFNPINRDNVYNMQS